MKKPIVPINGFLVGIVIAVGLAFLWPAGGAKGGWLRSEVTTNLGVAVIFLLQGLLLPTEDLWRGLRQWRLHLFVQVFGFVVIPALVLLADLVGGHLIPPELRLGFLYLAILPTTISTATVFTTKAGGNIAGAIFNTSVSNVLGIFIVPFWSAWILSSTLGQAVAVWPLLQQIMLLLLLPLVVGQVLRPWLKGFAGRHRQAIGRINTNIIYFIIYAAFCNSVVEGVWSDHGLGVVLLALALVAVLLAVVMVLATGLLRLFRFDAEASVTGLFCATQKTLAAGVPMAKSIFAGAAAASGAEAAPALGLILLPLMCYHPLQIIVGGWLIGRRAAPGA